MKNITCTGLARVAYVGSLFITLTTCLGQESVSSLDIWKRRFLNDKDLADSKGVLTQLWLPAGLALVGRVDESIAAADKLRIAKDSVRHVAGVLSRVDRLDEALALVKRVDERQRNSALALIAHGQLNRGDLADGLKLASQVQGPLRDELFAKIISLEIELREFQKATEQLALIESIDKRLDMKSLIEQERSVPPIDDPGFVQKKIELALKKANKTFAVGDKPLPRATIVEFTRHSATAMQLHNRRDQKGCHDELRSAQKIAEQIENELNRFLEVILVACLAHKLNEPQLAHDIWIEVTENPKADAMYAALAFRNVRAFDVLAEVTSEDELAPLAKRWRDAKLQSEYGVLATSCARVGRYDRVDWLYRNAMDPSLRLMIDVTAIEALVQKKDSR